MKNNLHIDNIGSRLVFSGEPLLIILAGIILGIAVLIFPLKVGLLFILGIALFILIMRRPKIGFLLTVAAIPLVATQMFLPITSLITISAAKALGLLTLISWLFHLLATKRSRVEESGVVLPPQFIVLGGLWLAALVSIYFSVDPEVEYFRLAYKRVNHLIGITMLYFLTINIVSSRGFLKKVVVVLVVAITLVALFAIIQRYLIPTRLESQFYTIGAVADLTEEESLGTVVRSAGVSHPDILAVTMLIGIPLLLYNIRMTKTLGIRFVLVIALIGILVALFFTGSRAGVLGLLVILLFLVIKRVVRLSPGMIILCILFLSILWWVVPRTHWQRVFSLEHYRESFNVKVRKEMLRASLGMFKDHWITGVGVGNFDRQLASYSPMLHGYLSEGEIGMVGPHNMLAEMAAEQGVFGLSLLLIFLGLTFADFSRAQKASKESADFDLYILSVALEASFVGFLFWSLFHGNLLAVKEWWLVAGLAVVLNLILKQKGNPSREIEIRQGIGRETD